MEERNTYGMQPWPRRLSRRQFLKAGGYAGVGLATASVLGYDIFGGPLGASALAAGETATPKRGGTIKIRLLRDVSTFDPHLAISGYENELNHVFYNGLLWNPKGYDVELDAAEKYELSPDGKTLTFFLRRDVKYHDGRQMSAEDVKWSFEKQMGLISGFRASARTAWMKEYVNDITVMDPYTVRFNLRRPAPVLLPLFTTGYASIIPKGSTADDLKKAPIGSGPFMLAQHDRGSVYVLKRNPNYFKKDIPYLDGYEHVIIRDQAAYEFAFLTKRIDAIRGLWSRDNKERIKELVKKGEVVQYAYPSGCRPAGLLINHKRAPWTDVRVRKAAFLAIDRQALIEGGMDGDGQETLILDTGGFGRSLEEIRQMPGFRRPKDQDIAEAKRLLAAAGYANGFDEPVMAHRIASGATTTSEIVQASLATVGIRAKIVPIEDPAFFDRLASLDYGISYYSFCQQTMDPDELFSAYFKTGGSRNWLGYSNPKFDSMFDQMSSELDAAKRKMLAQDMERLLLDDVAYAPIAESVMSWTFWNYVKGYPKENYRSWYTESRKERWWRDQ